MLSSLTIRTTTSKVTVLRRTDTGEEKLSMSMHNPPHPGMVLREYLGDLAVSAAAAHLRVTRVTLSRVLNGKSGISAAMAIRLSAALGTTPELWMNMQSQYDLWRARQARQPAVRRFAHVAAG
jgi:addiction module HigA family antidote